MQESRDPMRGPLGSLIAQAQQEPFQKALPPSLFAEHAALIRMHVECQSREPGEGIHLSCQLTLATAFVAECELPPTMADIPVADSIAICSDSHYLFGYWNKA